MPLSGTRSAVSAAPKTLNLLYFYDPSCTHITTCYDHLTCLGQHTTHNVLYAPGTNQAPVKYPLDLFDGVILHYSVRLPYDGYLSPEVAFHVTRYNGLKALFIQDEYDHTWKTCEWINRLGIQLVFTCVPPQYVKQIYARVDHSKVEFIQVLTGYVPSQLDYGLPNVPLKNRRIAVGYRGRELPFRYGQLGREKYTIGVRMKEICQARCLSHDIEWSEEKRVYGDGWLQFLAGCRATLGAESGCNVFDFDGTLDKRVNEDLRHNPQATFEEIYARHLHDLEREPIMNQISPRVFEAIAVKTALVLFEGSYSDVIAPGEHYIPLKKDFSNVDEVLKRVADDDYVEALVERAYDHVIGSGQYSYREFARSVVEAIERRIQRPKAQRLLMKAILYADDTGRQVSLNQANLLTSPEDWRLGAVLGDLTSMTPDLLGLCQGRLTTQSQCSLTPTDSEEQPTLYFTPHQGNRVALYTGSWRIFTFEERWLQLRQVAAGVNYDVFLRDHAGTFALELCAWKNDLERATQLMTFDGILVMDCAPTHRYLGTIRGSGPQEAADSKKMRYVWNAYNQIEKTLLACDMNCHTYASPEPRAWDDNPNVHFGFVLGRPQTVGVQLNSIMKSNAAGEPALVFPTLNGQTQPHIEFGRYAGNYNPQFLTVTTGGSAVLNPGHYTVGAGEEATGAGGTFASVWLRGTICC